MDLATIALEQPVEGVLVATLNRPDRLNAQTFQMFDDLAALPLMLRDEDELRALIVTGAGRAFCAGFDLDEIGRITELGVREFLKFQELATGALAAIRALPAPVIAAVTGPAAGAGPPPTPCAGIPPPSRRPPVGAPTVRACP